MVVILWLTIIVIKMTKIFTCVTLSKEPIELKVPDNCAYLNQVQTFTKDNTLHLARLSSIRKINTPYFFICDSDDPVPETLFVPHKAIIYGDMYIIENGIERIIKAGDWNSNKHIYNPQFIHKAICNTEFAKKVIDILPIGDYYTDQLLYYCLALYGGSTYNENLIMRWNKFDTGHHRLSKTDVINSVNWLLVNQKRLELIKL